MTTSQALAPGDTLQGRYRITRLLGKGGMGAVYQAQDMRLGNRPVAVKENFDASAEAQTQFRLEATTLAALNHPNLPRVSDHFIEPSGKQYLVMDFVEGQDLQEMLDQRGRLNEAQALPWIEQVCGALEYLHSRNPPIIHRDIKPANIRITPAGRAMLVDFGIAKQYHAGQQTVAAARAVTSGFSPLEQYGGGAGTDVRSDVYALGATLYCLLTGQPPPDAPARLSRDALAPPRKVNPGISQATESAILAALALTPSSRPSVDEFRKMLQHPAKAPSTPTEASIASAGVGAATQTSQRLDFGVMLPRKVRWLSLDIVNRDRRRSYQLNSSQSWIRISPVTVECRVNERCRVRVSVDTKVLQADTGSREQGYITVATGQTSNQVAVSVRVESMAGIYSLLRFMFNILLGTLCGALVFGGGGNLALALGGLNSSVVLLLWGAIIGGLALSVAGIRLQDTANLVLALLISAVVLGIIGALVGALIGLLAALAVGQWDLIRFFTSVGLCMGITGGMIYAIRTPERWGIWPF